jgi:hypothetical protein
MTGEEELDIVCDRRLWLMTTLQRQELGSEQTTYGRAYFKLDPASFDELTPREVRLALDTGGSLLLRVVMEQERHDPQYHFGRAFRSLHLAQVEMIRMLVDKVSLGSGGLASANSWELAVVYLRCKSQMHPTVRDILSRKTLRKLLPSGPLGTTGIAGDALNKLSAAYRTSLTFSKTTNAIPAVKQSASGNRKDLSDVEVEDAIGPLLDYLDANLQILSEGLTEPNLYAVLVRLWREIVAVIEGLTVPALSARRSTMQPLSDRELDVVLRWLKVCHRRSRPFCDWCREC